MRYTAILNPTGYSLSGFSEKPDIQRYSTLSAYALQAAGEDDAEVRGVAPVRNRSGFSCFDSSRGPTPFRR